MPPIKQPFGNEFEQLQLNELTIENRVDRIAIFGSLEITRDQAGLQMAVELAGLLNRVVGELSGADLPEHITITPTVPVDNPFGE